MGVAIVRFEVANQLQFERMFETMNDDVQDLTEPYNQIANEFYDSMKSVFNSEGSFEGRSKWAELSPAYKAWKDRHYAGKKILELTGALSASLTTKGGYNNVTQITATELVMGTRTGYAMYHQTGTKRMPMRKIIELTDPQRKRWTSIIHRYLFSQYDKAATNTRSF